MKKLTLLLVILLNVLFVRGQDIKQLTFGIGAGYSYSFDENYAPSLSTDPIPKLKLQKIAATNFVISPMIIFKFSKLKVNAGSDKFLRVNGGTAAKYYDKFSINMGINLLEVKNDDLAFNKSIDGGLGIGYFLNPDFQVALSYDISSQRQLQDYISSNYLDQPIPNGKEFFNALDEKNNNLFYTKKVSAISFKVVFSIGNKK